MPRSSSVGGATKGTGTSELDWALQYDLYADRLRRVIQRRVGPEQTEDVLQETFVRAIRNSDSLDPSLPIAPWLITIALRAATDAQRQQLRTVYSELAHEESSEESGFGCVEEELLRTARLLGIKHALAGLKPNQRRMLEAVAFKGASYDELAKAERTTVDAVKMAIFRARTNFRNSYDSITRGEVYGGIVGAALWRLRSRLHRYYSFVGEHATAFGAATLTVAAVGIIAFPAARPIAIEAFNMATNVEIVATSAGEAATSLPASPSSHSVEVPTGDTKAPNNPSLSGREKPDDVTPSAKVTAGIRKEDERVFTGVEITSDDDDDTRTWAGVTIHCNAGKMGSLKCDVVDLLPPSP
jgi:RNA polymerase sigma-70 factor (ECF subfamily)